MVSQKLSQKQIDFINATGWKMLLIKVLMALQKSFWRVKQYFGRFLG